jgi:HEAT repeat protein
MSGQIFISYHHNDGDFAEILRQRLKDNDFDVWMSEAALTCGDDWRAEIDQAIEEASALVLIMTPDAKASDYVTYEWAFAIGAGIRVVPILLKETELHPRLELLHYLDFTNRMARPWDDLIKALKEKAHQGQPKIISSIAETSQPCTIKIPEDAPLILRKAIAGIDSFSENRRIEAIQFIARFNHPASTEVLISALMNHPIAHTRAVAAWYLREIGDARIIPILIEALKDKDRYVRINSAWTLGEIGDATAMPGLIEALKDKDEQVQARAANALEKISTPKALSTVEEWRKEHSSR